LGGEQQQETVANTPQAFILLESRAMPLSPKSEIEYFDWDLDTQKEKEQEKCLFLSESLSLPKT
jgi:hypothetical protein